GRSVLVQVGVVPEESGDVVVAGVVVAGRDRRAQVGGPEHAGLGRRVEPGGDHRHTHLVGGVLVVGDAEEDVDVVDLGRLGDLLDDLGGVGEGQLLGAGDVDQQVVRALDAARQQRAVRGGVRGLL